MRTMDTPLPGFEALAPNPVRRLMNMAAEAAEYGFSEPMQLDGYVAKFNYQDTNDLMVTITVIDATNGGEVLETKVIEL